MQLIPGNALKKLPKSIVLNFVGTYKMKFLIV